MKIEFKQLSYGSYALFKFGISVIECQKMLSACIITYYILALNG